MDEAMGMDGAGEWDEATGSGRHEDGSPAVWAPGADEARATRPSTRDAHGPDATRPGTPNAHGPDATRPGTPNTHGPDATRPGTRGAAGSDATRPRMRDARGSDATRPGPDRDARPLRPDPFARSVRLWLRAYPTRWRAVRGEEMLGVLRDLAGPGATRLTLREGLGLVRAGWATRWRSGPPVRTRLAYRYLDRRIPAAHREWARDDIAGRWYSLRKVLWTFGVIAPLMWVPRLVLHGWPDLPAVVFLLMVVCVPAAVDVIAPAGGQYRKQATNRHLAPAPGEPLVPGGLARGCIPRRRIRALPGTDLTVATLAVGALLWGSAALLAHRGVAAVPCAADNALSCTEFTSAPWHPGWWALCAVAAVVLGSLAAVRARRRIHRFMPDRSAQPARVLGPARVPATVAWFVVIGGPITWVAWLEATGRMVALASPLLALVCLFALPGALAVRRSARQGPADLALTDLWRMGVDGMPVRADAPIETVVRLPVEQGPTFAPG